MTRVKACVLSLNGYRSAVGVWPVAMFGALTFLPTFESNTKTCTGPIY